MAAVGGRGGNSSSSKDGEDSEWNPISVSSSYGVSSNGVHTSLQPRGTRGGMAASNHINMQAVDNAVDASVELAGFCGALAERCVMRELERALWPDDEEGRSTRDSRSSWDDPNSLYQHHQHNKPQHQHQDANVHRDRHRRRPNLEHAIKSALASNTLWQLGWRPRRLLETARTTLKLRLFVRSGQWGKVQTTIRAAEQLQLADSEALRNGGNGTNGTASNNGAGNGTGMSMALIQQHHQSGGFLHRSQSPPNSLWGGMGDGVGGGGGGGGGGGDEFAFSGSRMDSRTRMMDGLALASTEEIHMYVYVYTCASRCEYRCCTAALHYCRTAAVLLPYCCLYFCWFCVIASLLPSLPRSSSLDPFHCIGRTNLPHQYISTGIRS